MRLRPALVRGVGEELAQYRARSVVQEVVCSVEKRIWRKLWLLQHFQNFPLISPQQAFLPIFLFFVNSVPVHPTLLAGHGGALHVLEAAIVLWTDFDAGFGDSLLHLDRRAVERTGGHRGLHSGEEGSCRSESGIRQSGKELLKNLRIW